MIALTPVRTETKATKLTLNIISEQGSLQDMSEEWDKALAEIKAITDVCKILVKEIQGLNGEVSITGLQNALSKLYEIRDEKLKELLKRE